MSNIDLVRRYEKTVIKCLVARIDAMSKLFSPHAKMMLASELYSCLYGVTGKTKDASLVCDGETIKIRYIAKQTRETLDQLLPEMRCRLHMCLRPFLSSARIPREDDEDEYEDKNGLRYEDRIAIINKYMRRTERA